MITPDSATAWWYKLSTLVHVLVVLACVLLVVPSAGAQPLMPVSNTPSTPAVPPLSQFLDTDGTLVIPTGKPISLDARGYQLVGGPGEAPRFAATGTDLVPGDENWASGLFPMPGTNGTVYALAMDANGDLYVGGDFTIAGGVFVNRIAKWDGNTWSALGRGVRRCVSSSCMVRALAFDADGNLYVGGWFTRAGDIDANSIAKWDGNTWSALGSGINGSVEALAFDAANHLYVGGNFSTAGGVSTSNIAKWDGSNWSPLGSGVNDFVFALATDTAGNLYAGGIFATAGGVNTRYIAKWDGGAWSGLSGGMDGGVYALTIDESGNLYAGGGFTTAGGISAIKIARWDGSAWSPLDEGMSICDVYDACVRALAFDMAGNLYAGGNFRTAGNVSAFRIAKWDGTNWSPLGDGIDGYVEALAVDAANNLYAGSFNAIDRIAKWDGNTWSALGDGLNNVAQVLAVDADGNLYAGGRFSMAGEANAHHIAKWDGAAWSALGSGMNDRVYALAFDASGNLYAGGTFTMAGGVDANYVAQWDGTNWSPLDSGMGGCSSAGCAVYALAVDSGGNLYAGGDFTTAGGVVTNSIARWDGEAWSPLGTGMGGAYYPRVHALALDTSDNLYAGGWFESAGGTVATYIARWDGSIWSALGNGLGNTVLALAIDAAGKLYAGGFSGISQWNGSHWATIPSGMNWVYALTFDAAGNLYVGGDSASGWNAVARWNGTTWSGLGSGVGTMPGSSPIYADVNSLVVDAAGNLYAGGDFSIAGNQVSAYVARWTAADGAHNVTAGSYTFYTNNLPVTVDVVTPGTLDRLAVQRVNRSHPQAGPDFDTGYYWQVVGSDTSGDPAVGYVVDLTLPTTFAPDAYDQVCRWRGSVWNCGANAYAAFSVTRRGITRLSDWTAVNYSHAYYLPLLSHGR